MVYLYKKQGNNSTERRTDMTKREMAKVIAENMNKVNGNVNIERQTVVLMKGMTSHEIEVLYKAQNRFYKAQNK